MSDGRGQFVFRELVILMVVIFGLGVAVTAASPVLDNLRTDFNKDPSATFNQEQNNNEIYTKSVLWVPLIALVGAILLVVFNVFSRQRTTRTDRRRF